MYPLPQGEGSGVGQYIPQHVGRGVPNAKYGTAYLGNFGLKIMYSGILFQVKYFSRL